MRIRKPICYIILCSISFIAVVSQFWLKAQKLGIEEVDKAIKVDLHILTVAGEFKISLYYMKRNCKLIYYSILSSRPIISKTFTNKPFQKGSHINNTFLKGGFYFFKCQGKESLSYQIYHTVSHLSDIRLNFQLYLTSHLSFYQLCGSLITKRTFQLHFDSIIEHNTH